MENDDIDLGVAMAVLKLIGIILEQLAVSLIVGLIVGLLSTWVTKYF
jgi:preprotein translocase subunit SecF